MLILAAYASKVSTKTANRGSATANTGDSDSGGGGLSWLTSVAEQPASGTSAPTATSPGADGAAAIGGDPDDWLAAATSSGQTKRKKNVTATAAKGSAAPAAPGGWLSSGKLGVSTKDGSDSDEDDATGRGAAAATKGKKRKKARRSASAASGAEGWLASGTLGAPAEDESDDEEDSDGGRRKAILVSAETQTDDDIQAIVERGVVPKLPPWAKPYVPPRKPEEVPAVAAEEAVKEDVSWLDHVPVQVRSTARSRRTLVVTCVPSPKSTPCQSGCIVITTLFVVLPRTSSRRLCNIRWPMESTTRYLSPHRR